MKNTSARQFHSKSSLISVLFLAAITTSAQLSMAQQVQTNSMVLNSSHVTTVVPLREMKEVPSHNISKVMPEHDEPPFTHITNLRDAVEQQMQTAPPINTEDLLNFSGITGSQGGGFVPPDTNSDVGATQVVETVNLAYAVYNKTNGNVIMQPKGIQTLYAPLGGVCATANLSDPVATWDHAARRWVITIIAFNNDFSQNAACIAVSTSTDATGTFHLYSFDYKRVLPDYPKLGVWPDAYYLTTDSFPNGGVFGGAETCALDRSKMLAGQTANAVCFQRGPSDFALLPADFDGNKLPPGGAPNFQMDLTATSNNQLNLYKFHVDFVHTQNSTFTGPTLLTVASYSDACGGIQLCILEPSPGELVDGLGNRLMHRLPYRNYGDHEAMVAVHSIAPTSGSAKAATRWYEIRNPNSSPTVFQSGTIVFPKLSPWMGSIAMDKVGDIALGFSASDTDVKPLIAYVGRVPSDPKGKMRSPVVVVRSTGVQTGGHNRWGDYSSMQIDPHDDCTFWYTQMYYTTNGADWNTRMNSFKFKTCQ